MPVVTGLGHEDDLTVADLVADHRAATPTAAIVDLLPSTEMAQAHCLQRRQRIHDHFIWLMRREHQKLLDIRETWQAHAPHICIEKRRDVLQQKYQLLKALSPDRWLLRGFSIVRNSLGEPIRSVYDILEQERLTIELSDGQIDSRVDKIHSQISSE